ncbi:MAG: glucose-6-phosphate isomerase, partial [Planctomycetota bacterium]
MLDTKNRRSEVADAFAALEAHKDEIGPIRLKTLFEQDPSRGADFSRTFDDLYVDFSRQRITRETLKRLIRLAEAADLRGAVDRMFAGEPVNKTEQRAALHMALRALPEDGMQVAGADISGEVAGVLAAMKRFT